MNLTAMIGATKALFLKYVVRAMVAIGMRPRPFKIIGREACLQAKGLSMSQP
jgi:hypothetical protein